MLDLNESVFALLRTSPDGTARVIALHNVSGQPQTVALQEADAGGPAASLHDLLDGRDYPWQDGLTLRLEPYQVMWLKILK